MNAHAHEQGKLERLTFFSDAVFAIAMTLLVIEVRVPHLAVQSDRALARALVDLVPNYIGFIVSFVVIARFWMAHHRLMGLLERGDQRLVRANLALLMAIAFMPFPTAVLSDYAIERVAVGFYAVWLMLVGLANLAVIGCALGGRRLVRADADAAEIAEILRLRGIPLLVGALALAAGMIAPHAGLLMLLVGTPLLMWLMTPQRSG
ncbi:MAG: TMEM175 family protein [Sphingomonas bacterium]